MPSQFANSRIERLFIGKTLCTAGMILMSVGLALFTMAFTDFSAPVRTAGGLTVSFLIGVIGQMLYRHGNEESYITNSWFTRATLCSAYGLAYFFVYAMFYVPYLQSMQTPYLCWFLMLVLAFIGTVHSLYNPLIRRVTSVGALLATGHFMYNSMTSTQTVLIMEHSVNVSALGCFAAMLWSTLLSGFYKRQELNHPSWADCTSYEQKATWVLYVALHEFYFVLAALCTMAIPYFLERFEEAPIWWSLLAMPLALISWRNGKLIKQAVVASVWTAAAALLSYATLYSHSPLMLSSLSSVVVTGALMAAAFRTPKISAHLPSSFSQHLKAAGYSYYAYGAILVAMIVPVLDVGLWSSVNYLYVDALVICIMAIAARDGVMHKIGATAGVCAMLLFFAHFRTWELQVVLPVVALSYALSMAYSYIHNAGGWVKSDFLPYGGEYAVNQSLAAKLETMWSWAGFATVIIACYQLVNHDNTAFLWAGVTLATISIGFKFDRFGYRLQGLIALGLAIAKLVVVDMTAGTLTWHPELVITVFRGSESMFIGACSLVAGILYFRADILARRGEGGSGDTADTADTGN